MMMPANYSAIAENEMVYVNGGWEGLIGPSKPISTLTSNIINIVGNTFMDDVIENTLGVMFGGKWFMKDALDKEVANDKDAEKTRMTMFGMWTNDLKKVAYDGYDKGTGARGVLNAGMRVIGGLAAIAQLMNNDVKDVASNANPIGITGASVTTFSF